MYNPSPPQGYPIQSPQMNRQSYVPHQMSPSQVYSAGMMRSSPQSGVVPMQQRSPQVIQVQPSPQPRNISMIQSVPQQLSQVVPSQVHQVERIEQPLQVVDLFQVEEPWRKRVQELERQLAQYQGKPVAQAPAPQQPQHPQQVFIQDDHKLDEMDKELSQAYSQIQQLINTLKLLQDENENYKSNLEHKQRLIDDLEDRLRDKQNELDDANATIDDLQAQLDEVSLQQNEKHTYLIEEVNTWKQKFIELNREFHTTQESLMLAQAELDNMKNGGVVMTKTSETTQVKKSTHR